MPGIVTQLARRTGISRAPAPGIPVLRPADRPPSAGLNVQRLANFFLFAILLATAFLNNWEYRRGFQVKPDAYLDVVRGAAHAPDQYRVGVIDPAVSIARHGGLLLENVLTVVDFVAVAAALCLLLSLLRRSDSYAAAKDAGRVAAEVTFLLLAEYYLVWLLWYHRPETLTAAALLAAGSYLITRPLAAGGMGRWLAGTGLILVTAAQSLVRADVALTFNLGILIVALLQPKATFAMPRRQMAATAAGGACTAAAIQYLLMHRIFPNAGYGDTPVFQLRHNLVNYVGYLPFFVFMAPVLWTAWQALGKRLKVSAPDASLLIGSFIFVGMWAVVGVLQEVRIFMPFALALAPLTVSLLLEQMNPLPLVARRETGAPAQTASAIQIGNPVQIGKRNRPN